MKLYVTMQECSQRGLMPTKRCNGRQYTFEWNPSFGAYACEVPSAEALSTLLKDNHNARMFVPGIRILHGEPVIPQHLVPPVDVPEVAAEPEPIQEVSATQPIETPTPEASKPRKGHKGK